MKKVWIAAMAAMLAASVGAQTRVGDCRRENITDVGVLNGDTSVVSYYTAEYGRGSASRKCFVDVGGKTEGPYSEVSDLIFSADGRAFAYKAKIDGKEYVISGGEKAGPYDDVDDMAFSPDGRVLAYSAEINDSEYAVVGDKKVGPYKSVDDLEFSYDSRALAYKAKIDGKKISCVFIDGAPYSGRICGGRAVWVQNGAVWTR